MLLIYSCLSCVYFYYLFNLNSYLNAFHYRLLSSNFANFYYLFSFSLFLHKVYGSLFALYLFFLIFLFLEL